MKIWLRDGWIGAIIGAIVGVWFYFYSNSGPHEIDDIILGLLPSILLLAIIAFVIGTFISGWLVHKKMWGWLKGGLITSIIFLTLAFVNYFFSSCQPWGFDVFTKILYPSIWHEMFVKTGCESGTIIIYSTIIWFIIGDIVGLIVAKVKKR